MKRGKDERRKKISEKHIVIKPFSLFCVKKAKLHEKGNGNELYSEP